MRNSTGKTWPLSTRSLTLWNSTRREKWILKRYCSMSTSITNCCMTKRYQIVMDQSACMACLRRGQGRQSPCVCRREFRMNSRRKGSPPQCFGDLARKNSLSLIVNKLRNFCWTLFFTWSGHPGPGHYTIMHLHKQAILEITLEHIP